MVDCKICEHPYCEHAGTQRGIVVNCANYMPRQKPQTNADRIRAMSDEELARWVVEKTVYQESAFSPPSYLNFLTGLDDTKESAIKGTVDWLRQPACGGE